MEVFAYQYYTIQFAMATQRSSFGLILEDRACFCPLYVLLTRQAVLRRQSQ